ncbi:hypothetical protein DFH09DRAFT_1079113 [Mycena vulgaris]|nr:hypothetical protein DFH09DRAFT_1079113 [Mycena vulgaris]
MNSEQPVGKHYMATQYSSARASDGWHKDKASRGHDMGPTKGRKSPKRAGKGVLGRARIWAVSSQYSQEAWGARRKSKGQQGPRYGACGGRKIPKTSWTWMHPHCHDVTQSRSATELFADIAARQVLHGIEASTTCLRDDLLRIAGGSSIPHKCWVV